MNLQVILRHLNVVGDAGKSWAEVAFSKVSQQNTAGIVAPVTNPRIDVVSLNISTGDVAVTAGTEAASPVAPNYPAGHYPICQIALSVAQTQILNADITDERPVALDAIYAHQKDAANGIAGLDSNGKLSATQLPPLAINDTFVVASEAAMLAVAAQIGDIATRTDTVTSYVLAAEPASTLSNWVELLATGAVVSVNGLTGAVVLSTTAISEGANLYYTDARVASWVGANAAALLAAIKTVDDNDTGLNATTLNGLLTTQFLRSDANGTRNAGLQTFFFNADNADGSDNSETNIIVKQNISGKDAFMTFHVAGDFAAHIGVDGVSNDWFVGGWSMGAVKHKIYHAGNHTSDHDSRYSLLDHNHSGVYEPAFSKNSAFNKSFGGGGVATTVSRSDHTHAGIGFRGSYVYHSTFFPITSGESFQAYPNDTEDYDTDSIHDTVTNNHRLYVPAGVTKVRLNGWSNAAGVTGVWRLGIFKNFQFGSGVTISEMALTNPSINNITVSTGVVSVVAGDWFCLCAYQSSGASQNVYVHNFSMEIVE